MADPSRIKFLVAYGSRGGSTREVAVAIAEVLRSRHIEVDIKSVADVETVCGYGGFIIGSGVYNGSWTPETLALVRQHRYILAHGAVWLFSVAAFGDSHPVVGRLMQREPREIAELVDALQPRSYRVFAGCIDPQRWSWTGRLLLQALGGRIGDNRDWAQIGAWAEDIAMHVTPAAGDTRATRRRATASRWQATRHLSVAASSPERGHPMPGDRLIDHSAVTLTHAITIDAEPDAVWPWLVQMGAGTRAGWYSYDVLDNGGKRSADRIVPALQTIQVGTLFPARPGAVDGFHVLQYEPRRSLVLGWRAGGELQVTWAFALRRVQPGRVRLVVRVRGGAHHNPLGLPRWLGVPAIRAAHFVMQRKQLLGIKQRAEAHSPFARYDDRPAA